MVYCNITKEVRVIFFNKRRLIFKQTFTLFKNLLKNIFNYKKN